MTPFHSHSKSICLRTLQMPEAILGVMGGPSRQEAIAKLKEEFGYTDAQIEQACGKQASTVEERADALVARLCQVGNEPTNSLNNPAPILPGDKKAGKPFRFKDWKQPMPVGNLPQLR